MQNRNPAISFSIAIILIGLAAFWPGLSGGFLFDDYPNLVLDPDWKVTGGQAAEWLRAMQHGIASPTGRPLALLSFAVNHYFTGLDPWPMKLTGLIWHLLNGCLVFCLMRAILDAARLSSNRKNSNADMFAAATVAIAWTIHPIQVSSALYIIQRMEVASYTFVILSLMTYLRARRLQQQNHQSAPWFIAAMVAMVVGMGFKESAALAPAYALVLEACFLRFKGPGGKQSRGLIAIWSALCILGGLVFVAKVLPAALTPEAYAARDFSLGERLLSQLHVLAMYLGQILLPLPQHLLFYYDQMPISRSLMDPPPTAIGAAVLLGMVVVAILSWRRRPLISLGIGWFFAAHALTSNVIPLELAFEHRNYFALLGVLVALIEPFRLIGRAFDDSRMRILATWLPLLGLAVLTAIHAQTWGDPMRLAVILASRNVESSRASYALGGELFKRAESPTSPTWSLAYKEFENAASLTETSPTAAHALMIMDGRAHKAISAARWDRMREMIVANKVMGPDKIQSLFGLVNCRVRGGCVFDDQQLADTLVAALEAAPDNPTLHTIYGNFAWNVMRDQELAISMAREAVELAPDNTVNHVNLLRFLLAPNLHDDLRAEQEVRRLLSKIESRNPDGRWDDELSQLLESLDQEPAKPPVSVSRSPTIM